MQKEFIIRDYREGDKAALMEISLPWLEENHILEPADIEQLTHPERVLEAYRNRGMGRALMEATIDAARAMGVRTLVLTSHHSLKAALHIYESYGFRYEEHDHVAFELSDIAMKKEL